MDLPSTPGGSELQTPTSTKSTDSADSGTKATVAVPVAAAFEAIQTLVGEALVKSGASLDPETQ